LTLLLLSHGPPVTSVSMRICAVLAAGSIGQHARVSGMPSTTTSRLTSLDPVRSIVKPLPATTGRGKLNAREIRGARTTTGSCAVVLGQQVRRHRQVITINRAALAAYKLQEGECAPSLAAVWLRIARSGVEKSGVLTHAAWCVSCGAGCIDRRPSPAHIRRWCDACGLRRHRPQWHQCPGCGDWWPTTRKNLIYCDDRCRKADSRGRSRTA
jgi:hypothetical protein